MEATSRLNDLIRAAIPLVMARRKATGGFRASQNRAGGFGFFPGTTSFVENCYASLRSLVFLRTGPGDPVRALGFLDGCQTVSGGFGRSSRAAPFLDTTWHALAALSILATKTARIA